MSSQAVVLPGRRQALAGRFRASLPGRHPALMRMLLAGFISSSGDRLHQVALAALILGMTNSMASAGLVFVVSTLSEGRRGLNMATLAWTCGGLA